MPPPGESPYLMSVSDAAYRDGRVAEDPDRAVARAMRTVQQMVRQRHEAAERNFREYVRWDPLAERGREDGTAAAGVPTSAPGRSSRRGRGRGAATMDAHAQYERAVAVCSGEPEVRGAALKRLERCDEEVRRQTFARGQAPRLSHVHCCWSDTAAHTAHGRSRFLSFLFSQAMYAEYVRNESETTQVDNTDARFYASHLSMAEVQQLDQLSATAAFGMLMFAKDAFVEDALGQWIE